MPVSASTSTPGPVVAIVVTYESAAVIEKCLRSLRAAAPQRGLEIRVVDNASTDESVAIASGIVGPASVSRLPRNLGFAAGVNAGLATVDAPWIAVINPDTVLPEGALDVLADVLERHPEAGVVGPRVLDEGGRPETTVGLLPTVARETAHAYFLDRLIGLEGRRARFPGRTAPVDWVSGCAWLLRAQALRNVGPLDEGYFMYCEDVDYCRRMRDAGWSVLATPDVKIQHAIGRGSSVTRQLPADGGTALLHYFAKFDPGDSERRVRTVLARGWKLRRGLRSLLGRLGDSRSAALAARFDLALRSLPPA